MLEAGSADARCTRFANLRLLWWMDVDFFFERERRCTFTL